MFALRVARLSSLRMGRQQTLGARIHLHRRYFAVVDCIEGKFFAMPPNKKAPPQQANLRELWGGKKATVTQENVEVKTEDVSASSASEKVETGENDMQIDESNCVKPEDATATSCTCLVSVVFVGAILIAC